DRRRVVAAHVRAVAPDDAGKRREEPPHIPGAAEDALRLGIERGRFLLMLDLEPQRALGVDAAVTVNERDEVASVLDRRPRLSGDRRVAARVDHDLRADGLPARGSLEDGACDAIAIQDRVAEPAVQAERDIRAAEHAVAPA